MALEREWEVYQRELPSLLANSGKYVLIKGDSVVELFDTYDDAIKSGYRQFGLDEFMVKQINAAEPVQFFSRDTSMACHN